MNSSRSGGKKRSTAELLQSFLKIPHKILHHEDVQNLTQMVLHEISHEHNLDLNRSAYLVDNPDFDCLKGVAGYCKEEPFDHDGDLWEHHKQFRERMRDANFHKKLRNIVKPSFHGKGVQDKLIHELADELGMKNPDLYTWNMKHGNHGVFIFDEGDEQVCRKIDGLLEQISALLELCPVNE